MKNQILGIFFYLLYLLAMVKPLMPIIEYYANYDYIANVLCENRDKPYLECNGKCYLQKQLNEVNHNNHEHKSNIPQINFEDYPLSPLGEYTYHLKNTENANTIINYFNYNTSQNFIDSVFKPPKLIS